MPVPGPGLELCTTPEVFSQVFAWFGLGIFLWFWLLQCLDVLVDHRLLGDRAQSVRSGILVLYHTLGIVINLEKSDLVSETRGRCLRIVINTVLGKLFPTPWVEKVLSKTHLFASVVHPERQWLVFLGHRAFLEKLVLQGLFH